MNVQVMQVPALRADVVSELIEKLQAAASSSRATVVAMHKSDVVAIASERGHVLLVGWVPFDDIDLEVTVAEDGEKCFRFRDALYVEIDEVIFRIRCGGGTPSLEEVMSIPAGAEATEDLDFGESALVDGLREWSNHWRSVQ